VETDVRGELGSGGTTGLWQRWLVLEAEHSPGLLRRVLLWIINLKTARHHFV
jgi:hypothetical protein